MILSENRYPPRIKCGAGFFGIMLERDVPSGSHVWRTRSAAVGGVMDLSRLSSLAADDLRVLGTTAVALE
jgi:hypothetical protein